VEQAPSGVPLTFEVTFGTSGLPVAMSVYDVTTLTPDLISGPTAMVNISGTNTYIGQFTAATNKNYVILKAVYTDESFTAFDPDNYQGSESITTQGGGGGGSTGPSSCTVVGYIQETCSLIGPVKC
jgi:hypothetical protein